MFGLFKMILVIALDAAITAWIMLCLHWGHQCDTRIPALGFWATFWVASACGSVVALVITTNEINKIR